MNEITALRRKRAEGTKLEPNENPQILLGRPACYPSAPSGPQRLRRSPRPQACHRYPPRI